MTKRRRWLRFTAHAARGAALLARATARSKLLRDHDGAVRDAERGVAAMGEALAVLKKPDRCSGTWEVTSVSDPDGDTKVGDRWTWN